MKSKFFTFILALIAGASMSLQAQKVKVGDLYYELNKPNDGEATVIWGISDDPMDDIENTQRYKGAITIPSSITYNANNYTVTVIGGIYENGKTDLAHMYGAFTNCTELTAISIPNTVTKIFSKSFMNCSSLTAITIPNMGVSENDCYVGPGLFEGCTSLEVISLGSGVLGIDEKHSINVYGYVTSLAEFLNEVGIPALKAIQVDPANPKYCSVDGVLFTKDMTTLIAYPASKEGTSYTIPASVTSITKGAFGYNKNLQSITIPDGVTEIPWAAFLKATGLKSISIPASVTIIEEFSFTNCSSLESVAIQNATYVTTGFLFRGCSSLKSVKLPTANNALEATDAGNIIFNIIGMQMFAGCSSLTSITIPDVVETIGDNAFANCSSLETITLPASLKSNGIGSDAFYGCSGLQSFSIANSNEAYAITDGVLYTNDKDSLLAYPVGKASDLFIPESTITTIADDAFSGANKLKAINIPDGVTTIGDNAFEKCNQLTSLVLPKKLTSIGEDAFKDCSNLASVTFPEGLLTIGTAAFDSDGALSKIVIPSTVTTIGTRAFAICTGLTSVTCYATVPPTLGTNCFVSVPASTPFYVPDLAYDTYNDDTKWKTLNLQRFAPLRYDYKSGFVATLLPPAGTLAYSGEITLPEVVSFGGFDYTVTGIAANAFRNANNLQSVSIPKTVTSIGEAAFYGATGLAEISVDAANTAFCSVDNVLMDKAQNTIIAYPAGTAATEYTTPASVTTIGMGAFAGSKNLKELTLSENVASIGEGAFANCAALTTITSEAVTPPVCAIVGKGTAYEETPFDGITKTIPVYVPAGTVEAYNAADGWSYFSNIQGPFDPTGKTAYELVDLSTESLTEGKYLIVFDDNKAHAAVSGKDLIVSSDELTIINGVAYVPEETVCDVTIAPLGTDSFSILLADGTSYLDLQAKNSVTTAATPAGFAITAGDDKTAQIAKYLPSESKTYVLKRNGNYFRMYSGTTYTLPSLYRLKKNDPTGIEDIDASSLQEGDRGRLILLDGQIFILRGDKIYTITGQTVK